MSFVIADSLEAALAAVAAGARPIAGGTDLVVAARQGTTPLPDALVAIDRLPELRGIHDDGGRDNGGDGVGVGDGGRGDGDGVRIGALVTHAELMTDATIVGSYTALADAAALVGSPSTRNIGTLGGNVMNASPAMDTGAPLLVLGATAELAMTSGSRSLSLTDLWLAPGATSAASDELCVALLLPERPPRSGSAYIRLEYRRAMEIAVVGAAASITLDDDGNVLEGRVALTAVAPTIIEIDDLDLGSMTPAAAGERAASAAREAARPISDLRASDTYRSHMIGVMAKRAVDAASRRAAGEMIAVPVNRASGIGAAR
jgi:CO/xanthine dehydrogenase FAD-binding subunit